MKRILLFIPFFLICSLAVAEKRIVFIEKLGIGADKDKIGQAAIGDVIDIIDYQDNYKQDSSVGFADMIVVDLTDEEVQQLLSPKCDKSCDVNEPIILEARERKVDVKNLNITKQGQNVTKTDLLNNTSIKSTVVSP